MNKNQVLSYSDDRNALIQRERALRRSGFEVFSVESESEARFEIEMGRCGTLLICFRVHPDKLRELTELFRKNCPKGNIIFVMKDQLERVPIAVDCIVLDSAGPDAIVRFLKPLGSAKAS
jgi:hypothetical protein